MHTWAYTCMNPAFFELTLRWLPEKPWPILKHMLVITAHDRPDLIEELTAVKNRLRPRWPISIVDDSPLRQMSEHYPAALTKYTRESLGVKIMLPLWVPAPFFFTDDDVIIVNDPSEFLASGTMWGSHSGLDNYSESGPDMRELTAWQDVIEDSSMTREEFNRNRTDAAIWHMPDLDRDDYHKVLYSFFSQEAADLAAASGGNRFRLMDQRFLTTWLYRNSGDVYATPVYRAWPYRNLPKSVPSDGYFIHYCASSQKPRYVEWLNRVADERGYTR